MFTSVGFAIRGLTPASSASRVVDLDLEHREGEIGYMVTPSARGRGIAPRAVELLTSWGFDELGLIRLELRIDVENPASERVAARTGYLREGVLGVSTSKRGSAATWRSGRASARTDPTRLPVGQLPARTDP